MLLHHPNTMIHPERIYCLGLSYHTAPLDVREPLSYTAAAVDEALAYVAQHQRFAEFAILSTCNRTEFYACLSYDHQGDGFVSILDFIRETKGLDPALLKPYLFRRTGLEAARHLCRVAAGLDSMVLGEPQILGQVGGAFSTAAAYDLAGPALSAIFHTAMTTGKRARTETAINRNPISVSSVAVQLAKDVIGDLAGKRAAVVGTGEMGRLAVKAFHSRGLDRLTVVNRTVDRATALAERFGAVAAPLADLPAVLADADVVICATGAKHTILDVDTVATALQRRGGQPLCLIDIAIPRDVEPQVNALEGIYLFDIDRLQTQVIDSFQERQQEIPSVEAIIDDEVNRFKHRSSETAVQPLITDLRRKAEAIRQRELARILAALDTLDEKDAEQLHHFSRSLVNKILHDPTVRLRKEAVNGKAAHYVDVVRRLFALER